MVDCKAISCSTGNFGEKMSNNVIPFPQKMTNEQVGLLEIEKELESVARKVKELTIELEQAHKYLKQLIDEHEVYKDAVERDISLLMVDFEPEDEY
jgi:archaellum component FlaC